MLAEAKVQVGAGHYQKVKYNTLERFISYHYQIDSVLKLGVKSLLEIGPGGKLVSDYLKQAGVAVTTVDFDQKVSPDIVADVRSLPLADKQFEVVMACEILEHIPFDEVLVALRELKRVSQRYAIISLPYRSTYFELTGKWPLIRTVLKKNFFDLTWRWPLRFAGFASSGQHYWEIDRGIYKLRTIRTMLEQEFKIIKEFSPVLDKYHYFFILEIKS